MEFDLQNMASRGAQRRTDEAENVLNLVGKNLGYTVETTPFVSNAAARAQADAQGIFQQAQMQNMRQDSLMQSSAPAASSMGIAPNPSDYTGLNTALKQTQYFNISSPRATPMQTRRKIEAETLPVGVGADATKRGGGPAENIDSDGLKRTRARGPTKEKVPIGHNFPPVQIGPPVSYTPTPVETIQNDPRVAPAPSQAGAKVSTAPLAIEDAPKKPPKVRGNPNRATPYDKIALSDKGMEQKDDKALLKNFFRTPEGIINMPREVFEETDFGSKNRAPARSKSKYLAIQDGSAKKARREPRRKLNTAVTQDTIPLNDKDIAKPKISTESGATKLAIEDKVKTNVAPKMSTTDIVKKTNTKQATSKTTKKHDTDLDAEKNKAYWEKRPKGYIVDQLQKRGVRFAKSTLMRRTRDVLADMMISMIT